MLNFITFEGGKLKFPIRMINTSFVKFNSMDFQTQFNPKFHFEPLTSSHRLTSLIWRGWAALPFSSKNLKTTVIYGTNFCFDSYFITKTVVTLSEESGSVIIIGCDTYILQLQFTVWVHKFN